MKKKILLIGAVILAVLLVLILLIGVIPLAINVLFKLNLNIWAIESEWDAGDALMFYGTVLSGAVTITGVIITLNHQNRKAKIDEAIRYKPILQIVNKELGLLAEYTTLHVGYTFISDDNKVNRTEFEEMSTHRVAIRNVGRGETCNTVIETFSVEAIDWEDKMRLQGILPEPIEIGEVIKDGYFHLLFDLPEYLFLPEEQLKDKLFEVNMKVLISYSDMFDRKHYQLSLHIGCKIHPLSTPVDTPRSSIEGYQYKKVRYEIVDIESSK